MPIAEKDEIIQRRDEDVSATTVGIDAEHNSMLINLQNQMPGKTSKKSLVEDAIDIAVEEWTE